MNATGDPLPILGPLHELAVTDPLLALGAVRKLREGLADAEALAVACARAQDRPWRAIAGPLGMPYRSVHRHFRHLDVRSSAA